MEGDGTSSGGGGGGCAGSGGNSRWSPTKDQISMLENLYKQGVRTPSAEQIQQITTRLRGFGHIEGKNVFYWFQNHKARQRQKQKQESFDYFNRFLHRTIPAAHHHHHVFPPCHPLPSNVVSGTYYQPQNDIGLYQQCPKVLLPSCINKRSSAVFTGSAGFREAVPSSYGFEIAPMHTADNITSSNCGRSSSNHQETLALFPMHPTGILQGRNSTGNSSGSTEECSGGQGQPGFFDFFSAGPGSFVSD